MRYNQRVSFVTERGSTLNFTGKKHALLTVFVCALLLVGCASNGKRADSESEDEFVLEENDRWENYNRAIFRFNNKVDRNVVKPIAKGYRRVVPATARLGVGNFFRNLLEPTTIINDLLQGKVKQAGADTGRFVINTTMGFLGLIDVATSMGLERNVEDFGQTLAVWGVKPGPFVMLPFLGPSNVRDGFGLIPYYFATDPRLAVNDNLAITAALIGLDVIDARAQLLGASRVVGLQLDPYIFVRESYRQRRANQIHDGDPPLTDDGP